MHMFWGYHVKQLFWVLLLCGGEMLSLTYIENIWNWSFLCACPHTMNACRECGSKTPLIPNPVDVLSGLYIGSCDNNFVTKTW